MTPSEDRVVGGSPPHRRSGAASERIREVLEAAEAAADTILEDAEEWAQRHLEEARERADRMTAERTQLLTAMSDDLLEQAEMVRRQSALLIGALDEALAKVRVDTATPGREETSAGTATGAEPDATQGAGVELGAPAAGGSRFQDLKARIAAAGAPRANPAEEVGPAADRRGEETAASAPSPPVKLRPRRVGKRDASEGARLLATQMAIAGSDRAEIASRLREEFGIDDPDAIVDGVIRR